MRLFVSQHAPEIKSRFLVVLLVVLTHRFHRVGRFSLRGLLLAGFLLFLRFLLWKCCRRRRRRHRASVANARGGRFRNHQNSFFTHARVLLRTSQRTARKAGGVRGRAQEAQRRKIVEIQKYLFCFFELFESLKPKLKSFLVRFLFWNAPCASLRYLVCILYVSFLLYIDYSMLMFFSVYSFSHSLLNPKQARRAASVCILLRVFSRRVRGSFFLSLSLSTTCILIHFNLSLSLFAVYSRSDVRIWCHLLSRVSVFF